jgi:hypothetical protein
LTVVEIIYNFFSWISPFGYISNLFGGEDNGDSVQKAIAEEESGFAYLWVYLGLVLVSWIVVKKVQPKCRIKYFLMIVASITGIMYMLSNLLLIFYYEYLFVSYIVENIVTVFCVVISLFGIMYSIRKVGAQILSKK